jgi:HK97 family phage portal protein
MLKALADMVSLPLRGKAEPLTDAIPSLGISQAPRRRLDGKTGARHLQGYGGTDAIDTLMACVDLYAQTTSNAEYHFSKDGKELSSGPDQPTTSLNIEGEAPEDLVNLLARPNPFMDYTEMMELAVIDFLLAGEFIWLKYKIDDSGKPLALYRLAPPLVEVEIGPKGVPINYVYTAPGGKPVKFSPDDIIHAKRPNPHNPWRGLGFVAGAPRMFDIELAQTESAAQYYEQGTRLTGVLESDRSVPPSTWEKMKRQFSLLYGGQSNAFKVAMLERGLKFNAMSATAVEANFVEMENLSKDRICRLMRVPTPLLGEMGSSTDRQAARESQRVFDNKTMRPFLNRLQEQITKSLTNAWGVEFKIDYAYVMPIEDRLDLAEALAGLPGVQVKDIRNQVGLEPLEDQKAEWKEIDDMILNLPGEDEDAASGGHADRPVGSEGGRPPKPGNTRAFPKDGSLPSTAAAQKALSRQLRKLRQELEAS